jgi:hypothetical protein
MQEPRSTNGRNPAQPILDSALRDGLHHLATPPVSSVFDERVLASLALPEQRGEWYVGWAAAIGETARSWWNGATLQLVLSGAACAVIVTLGGYALTMHAPLSTPSVIPANAGVAAAASTNFMDLDGLPTEAGSYQGFLLGRPRADPTQANPQVEPERRRGSEQHNKHAPSTVLHPRKSTGHVEES